MLEMADHDTIHEEGYRHRVDPLRKGLCLLQRQHPKGLKLSAVSPSQVLMSDMLL